MRSWINVTNEVSYMLYIILLDLFIILYSASICLSVCLATYKVLPVYLWRYITWERWVPEFCSLSQLVCLGQGSVHLPESTQLLLEFSSVKHSPGLIEFHPQTNLYTFVHTHIKEQLFWQKNTSTKKYTTTSDRKIAFLSLRFLSENTTDVMFNHRY